MGVEPAHSTVSEPLLAWYDRHARDLPWRVPPQRIAAGERPDPYRVWLSEIMLQQTTVAAVKDYFRRFTERWPRVEDLAAARDEEVMAAWAGLGYYARARNLLACARVVANEREGRFPESAEALKTLPGVGDYTAAAVAAIAFAQPVPVVDGNIERVTTRLHAIEAALPAARPIVRDHVRAITPTHRPGDFAQAMMDLGATICTPKSPACVICPIAEPCAARAKGRQLDFPVKAAKKAKPSRVGAVFVARRRGDGAVWLRRRPPSGMLGGMSEPPSSAWSSKGDGATGEDAAPFPAAWDLVGEVVHGFTHFDLTLEVWQAVVDAAVPADDGWWRPVEDLDGEALPTLMRKAVEAALAGGR